ncbi:hypothetical protein L3Q82_026438, partial [Scortum barcoo]
RGKSRPSHHIHLHLQDARGEHDDPTCFSSARRGDSGGKPVPADPGAPVAAVRTDDDGGDLRQAHGDNTLLPLCAVKIKRDDEICHFKESQALKSCQHAASASEPFWTGNHGDVGHAVMAERGDSWLVVESEHIRLSEQRAINSRYIWVTGMLQLQQADKTLLCKKKRDEGSRGHRGLWGGSLRSLFIHLIGWVPFVAPKSMGAQYSKTTGKDEAAVEKPAEGAAVAAKANGQENGHAKTNGDASPAAEEANKADVQANGSTPTEEAPKKEVEKVEGAEANGETEPAATNGEASAKPEEGTPSTSEDGKQKKKRFSFKKPSFKLSGFSFKKTKKESEEAAAEEGAAAGEQAEGEKAEAEEAPAEEAKSAEGGEEGAKEAAAEEPKAEEEAKAEEAPAAPDAGGEDKPAEASPTEPEAAASPEATAAAE